MKYDKSSAAFSAQVYSIHNEINWFCVFTLGYYKVDFICYMHEKELLIIRFYLKVESVNGIFWLKNTWKDWQTKEMSHG